MQRNEFCIPVRQVMCKDYFFLRPNNMQIICNEFISRCCYKSYTALSQWPLHVLCFHCMVISMQTLCKLKVRAVQWHSSWFFNGKWRCNAVEAICLPRRSAFFKKSSRSYAAFGLTWIWAKIVLDFTNYSRN